MSMEADRTVLTILPTELRRDLVSKDEGAAQSEDNDQPRHL